MDKEMLDTKNDLTNYLKSLELQTLVLFKEEGKEQSVCVGKHNMEEEVPTMKTMLEEFRDFFAWSY